MGGNHDDLTDFNGVTDFGYKYIQGSTNGPGTHTGLAQYYSWYIGLGNNHYHPQHF